MRGTFKAQHGGSCGACGRRGGWRARQRSEHTGYMGHDEHFGFHSQWDGEPGRI